ncbi:alginate lyase family protein [Chloroherpeton thalassium]|uniref:alginate lyase family protein n=1 Tax=Chloroherpeton thalassium TaxID=100716 RepID=UPI00145EFF90|nr:alginate lyase family protein [Chloroherpeton thalassium]
MSEFIKHSRYSFYFNPENRKDFFLQLLSQIDPMPVPLMRAEKLMKNTITVFGKEFWYGNRVDWQLDFIKNTRLASKQFYSSIRLPENGADVKVPWEVSRFQFVWTLGKAYWLSGRISFKDKFMALALHWNQENRFCYGINWMNPMEVAIRACNLIAGFYFFCEEADFEKEAGETVANFWMGFLIMLYQHGLYLESNLEYTRRSGNHLIANAVGLFMLGVFFKHTEKGKSWIKTSVLILESEIQRQTYPDGVNYEMSIAYHRMVTEMLLSASILAEINQVPFSLRFRDRLMAMLRFIRCYTRPDGSAPLIGDSDDGRLFWFNPEEDFNDHTAVLSAAAAFFDKRELKFEGDKFSEQALWLLGTNGWETFQRLRSDSLQLGSKQFEASQFVIMRSKSMHAIIDCGELGKYGWGGHGHNDTLSFELWIQGTCYLVDSGTYCYTSDRKLRNDFRSTRAHNTVMIDGLELAAFQNDFKVKADYTTPKIVDWKSTADHDILVAEHDAYKVHLSDPLTHNRKFVFEKKINRLTVEDRVYGNGTHTAEIFYHFAPKLSVEKTSYNKIFVTGGHTANHLDVDYERTDEEIFVEPSFFSPRYGVAKRNQVVRFRKRFTREMTFKVIFTLSEATKTR